MESSTDLEAKAQSLSAHLEKQLHEMTVEFDQRVRALGEQYGIRLITEVNVAIETKDDQEGQ